MAHPTAERFEVMPSPLRPKASQQAIVEHLDALPWSIEHLRAEVERASARAARLRPSRTHPLHVYARSRSVAGEA